MEMTTQVFTAMAMGLWTPGLDHHLFVKGGSQSQDFETGAME